MRRTMKWTRKQTSWRWCIGPGGEWSMLVTFPPFSLYQILPVTFDACELAYMRIEGQCFDNNHGNDNKMATFWI